VYTAGSRGAGGVSPTGPVAVRCAALADLAKYILQALYEATGQTGSPVDVVGTLYRRWPQIAAADVRAYAGALSARGHVMLRTDGAGAITGAGIRALSELWTQGAFGQIPPAVQPYVDRLHAAAREAAQVEEDASSTRPYSSVHVQRIIAEQQRVNEVIVDEEVTHEDDAPVELVNRKSLAPESSTVSAPPPAAGVLSDHVVRVREAIFHLTQEISAATNLSMEEWSEALELTAQLEGTLDTLGNLVAER
jgi:hypothetical protein